MVVDAKTLSQSSRRFIYEKGISLQTRCLPQHPQLRDCLICPTKDKVALVHLTSLYGLDYTTRTSQRLFDLQFSANCLVQGCGLLAAGGPNTEISIRAFDGDLSTLGHWTTANYSSGASINNSICIARRPGNAISDTPADARLYVSNNDHTVSVYDCHPPVSRHSSVEAMDIDGSSSSKNVILHKQASLCMRVPINYSTQSPDGRILAVLGDSSIVYFFAVPRTESGVYKLIHKAQASDECCFSADWSRDSQHCAVASQDGIVTLFDVRSLSSEQTTRTLATFKTSCDPASRPSRRVLVGAARSVKFSPGISSELLAFSEQTQYVNVVDARTFDPNTVQRVELPQKSVPTTDRASPDLINATVLQRRDWQRQPGQEAEDVNIFSRLAARQPATLYADRARASHNRFDDAIATALHASSAPADYRPATMPQESSLHARILAEPAGGFSHPSVDTLATFFRPTHTNSVRQDNAHHSRPPTWSDPTFEDSHLFLGDNLPPNSVTEAFLNAGMPPSRSPVEYDVPGQADGLEICGLAWSPCGQKLYVASEASTVAFDVDLFGRDCSPSATIL